MDTCGTKIWLPGISDPDALETASMLCGTAAMREHGEEWTSRHLVMTPDMIRQLPLPGRWSFAGRTPLLSLGCGWPGKIRCTGGLGLAGGPLLRSRPLLGLNPLDVHIVWMRGHRRLVSWGR